MGLKKSFARWGFFELRKLGSFFLFCAKGGGYSAGILILTLIGKLDLGWRVVKKFSRVFYPPTPPPPCLGFF